MSKSKNNCRKTIGILINSIDGYFQSPIWRGIKKVAEERNVNLLFFAGASLKSTIVEEEQQNEIFDLVNTKKMDGLIISSGSLINYIGMNKFKKFIQKYKDIPIVSISVEIDGIPSVVFDNRQSMHMIVNHLIEHHNYRKIAFITGTSSNPESVLRLEGYKDALREHGIEMNDNMIVEGDFHSIVDPNAINELVKNIELKPDVIVASNDEMAIEAHFKLKRIGLEAGKDIAITGVDDIEEAESFFPALTTIKQPIFEMASRAMELICDMLEGLPVPMYTGLNGELIVRESCGCSNIVKNIPLMNHAETEMKNVGLDYYESVKLVKRNINQNKESILESMLKKLGVHEKYHHEYKPLLERFIGSFMSDLEQKRIDGEFIKAVNYHVSSSVIVRKFNYRWNEVLDAMKDHAIENVSNDELLKMMYELFYSARAITGNIFNKAIAQQYNSFKRMYVGTRNMLQKLNTALYEEQLVKVVKNALSLYGMKQCYLCLYDEPVKNRRKHTFVLPDKVRMVLGYNNGVDLGYRYFDTGEMLPDEVLYQNNRTELIIYPLLSNEDHFGYVALDLNAVNEFVFETFREQISGTLQIQRLFLERLKAEEELNIAVKDLEKLNSELKSIYLIDELTGLFNRRGFNLHGGNLFKSAMITGGKIILCFGDMDGLKIINDTYGHSEGDAALKAIAQILKKSFDEGDIVARFAGDEFTVLIPNKSSESEMDSIREKIDINIKKYNEVSNKPYKISMSVGFSVYLPDSKMTFDKLIFEADKKLYEQKSKKR